jgi:hypothetical protein
VPLLCARLRRSDCGLILALSAFLLFAIWACNAQNTTVSAPESPPQFSQTDLNVLECALSHLENQELELRGKGDALVVSSKTDAPCFYVQGEWELTGLELGSQDDVRALALDIARRNKVGVSIAGVSLPSWRLEKIDNMPIGESFVGLSEWPQARLVVSSWLPGFSTTGDQALILMLVGPDRHGALAGYLINRDSQDRWTVSSYDIVYFK